MKSVKKDKKALKMEKERGRQKRKQCQQLLKLST